MKREYKGLLFLLVLGLVSVPIGTVVYSSLSVGLMVFAGLMTVCWIPWSLYMANI